MTGHCLPTTAPSTPARIHCRRISSKRRVNLKPSVYITTTATTTNMIKTVWTNCCFAGPAHLCTLKLQRELLRAGAAKKKKRQAKQQAKDAHATCTPILLSVGSGETATNKELVYTILLQPLQLWHSPPEKVYKIAVCFMRRAARTHTHLSDQATDWSIA